MNGLPDSLQTALPKWCGSGVRTADAAGNKVLAYANGKRQLSVRALCTVGKMYEKEVSVTAGTTSSACFKPSDELSSSVQPLDANDLKNQIMQMLPPSAVVRVSELSAKVSGPVVTTVIQLVEGTTLSAELCVRALASPRLVDIKIQGCTLYVMQAKPSQVKTSLDYLGNRNGFSSKQRRIIAGKAFRKRRSKQGSFRSTVRRRVGSTTRH